MKNVALWIWATFAICPAATQAATILSVDLSTINQVTITAGAGVSSASASGSDFTGFYLDQFFGGNGGLASGLISGNLTTANNPTDNSPLLYRAGTTDPGLNIWAFSSDATVSFTAGLQAFTGSATWALSAVSYANMLSGNATGSIFFAADSVDDVAGATAIGEWEVVTPPAPVPLPASAFLLGAGLIGFGVYGRRKKKAGEPSPA